MTTTDTDDVGAGEGGSRLPTARVLSIAGSDSGGGAGIQADIKAMMAQGVHAMTAITAITAQNSLGVSGVWPLPPEAVTAQFRAVVDDIGVDAVKTGMLGSSEIVDCVARLLGGLAVPVVIDPVCVSKHGDPLIDDDAIDALRTRLLRVATVVTPNLNEASRLSDLPVDAGTDELAGALAAYGPQWVLIKGGHATGEPVDHLYGPDGGHTAYPARRADNRHTHGTGCTLASTLAARLGLRYARGEAIDVPAAMEEAKAYITGAIEHGFALGGGIGPVDHLWQLRRWLGN